MTDIFGLIEARMAARVIDGSRPSTVLTKRKILRQWSSFLGERDVVEAMRHDVLSFLGRPNLTGNTRAQYLTTLRVFYDWAVSEGHLGENPTTNIKGPKIKPGLPRPMPVEHFRLACATASRNVRTWLMLGALAGLRCCEMAELHTDDLDLEAETPTMVIHGKGGKLAIAPIHPSLLPDLKARAGYRLGWLFPHHWRADDHVLPGSVSKLVNKHLREVGIDSTAHALRHLFGTSIYKVSNADLRLTQELLRHSSPATTAIYTKVEPVEAAQAVRLLDLTA